MEHTLAALCRCAVRRLLIHRPSPISCNRCHSSVGGGGSVKTHYVVLGITPAATQADVKAAYYKLSKVYHPDRQHNKADPSAHAEHLQKFRHVTAAYEVLGNVKLRKLYDKGMMHVVGSGSKQGMGWKPPEDDDPALKFYRSREVKSRPPPPTTNTPLYDFDEWSKQHYGATFARDQTLRQKIKFRADAANSASNDIKVERILIVMGVLTLTIMFINADMSHNDKPVVVRRQSTPAAAPPPPQLKQMQSVAAD